MAKKKDNQVNVVTGKVKTKKKTTGPSVNQALYDYGTVGISDGGPQAQAARNIASNPISPYSNDASGIIGGRDPNAYVDKTLPTAPDIESDPEYLAQAAYYNDAYKSFLNSQDLMRTQYADQVKDQMRKLGWVNGVGWDPRGRLSDYGNMYRDNEGDFAGRGMWWSGLFDNSVADINQTFNNQKTNIDNAQARYNATLDQQSLARKSQLDRELALAAAQAANNIQRRAASQSGSVAG